MFSGCSSLTSLDLSNFNTSNVKYMNILFEGCSSLSTLDVRNFDTSKVTDMTDMFKDCKKLKSLTLGINFRKVPKEAGLVNGDGWVNLKTPTKIVSGDGQYAVIDNYGKNNYKRIIIPTYPTNIKYTYNQGYHQLQFTWDKVKGADRYSIAVYQAGKWVIQKNNITTNSFVTPKNLTLGKTYKVAIAARVGGKWDNENAIKHAVTVTIPAGVSDFDGDGYYDTSDPRPSIRDDYSFLNNEIYSINMYHDDENASYPIEAVSSSSVKTTNKSKDECDDENYFRFKWCGNGYKLYSVKYESNNKVLSINQSGDVVLEEDKNLPSQIWEVLPYGYSKDNLPIDGLRFRSKLCYTPDCKPTSYFLSYDGSKLTVTTKDARNKVKVYSPKGWTRFGEMLLNKYGWENTGASSTTALENYDHNVSIGVDPEQNIYKYGVYDLLINQEGGNFPKLNFVDVKMDEVCCEIMGTYNALLLDNVQVDFFKLAAEFEENACGNYYVFGGNGWAGSDPKAISSCLDAYNVNYTTIDIADYRDIADLVEVPFNPDVIEFSEEFEKTYNNKINKPACDAFDTELKNGVCGIISYKFDVRIHTYAAVYNSYSAVPISTFNLLCKAKPKDYPKTFSSTYDALKNYNKGKLKNIDHYLVGYVLK
ncbi:surface protein [Ruminococcus albus]|uniref:Surface protein n=2 Tax=Ruminococcus albus TaxID=1264 RepID=A0A1H7KPA2_RUMAL|nr:surface protein [Ruminococcus albus]